MPGADEIVFLGAFPEPLSVRDVTSNPQGCQGRGRGAAGRRLRRSEDPRINTRIYPRGTTKTHERDGQDSQDETLLRWMLTEEMSR